MTAPERFSTPTALVGAALMVAHHAAVAQAAAQALAACVEMAGDRDRLACYDRAMGRASVPSSDGPSSAATTATPAAAEAVVASRAALPASGSMIDRAWAFDPSSARYDVSLQTSPKKGFFAYFRWYSPTKAFFDRSWKMGSIVEVQ